MGPAIQQPSASNQIATNHTASFTLFKFLEPPCLAFSVQAAHFKSQLAELSQMSWLLLHKMENVFQTPAKNYVQAQKIHFFYQTPISILAASCGENCLSFPV